MSYPDCERLALLTLYIQCTGTLQCTVPTHTASLMMGETLEGLANGVDTYSYKQPLGVCAGICPFNFPAMIPLWMFPVAW
jgi:acyl-CoA reductase-like NAD-dependent aldehyde dehydrogenase